MKKKKIKDINFKDSESYFRFINKYQDKINVLSVKPVFKKKYKITLFYEIKESENGRASDTK